MLEVSRGEGGRPVGTPLHCRPSLQRDSEPGGANQEARADYAERRLLVAPQGRRADGERADDQRIGHEQRVVARPDRLTLRVDQVDKA
jgi:hypothetical protein